MYCKNCGAQIAEEQISCAKCGAKNGTGDKFCPNCGKETAAGIEICPSCNHRFKGTNAEKTAKTFGTVGLVFSILLFITLLFPFVEARIAGTSITMNGYTAVLGGSGNPFAILMLIVPDLYIASFFVKIPQYERIRPYAELITGGVCLISAIMAANANSDFKPVGGFVFTIIFSVILTLIGIIKLIKKIK